MKATALILVDLQNDFLPGGSLAVEHGDEVIPVINKVLEKHPFDVIVATKDWHPKDHDSFASVHKKKPGERIDLDGIEQILWPVHCVQETPGAEFSPHLHTEKIEKVFFKGTDKKIDSYSTFFDNGHRKKTGLEEYLRKRHVEDIYIAGLATDYCVKYSVLDALELGFNTFVIEDACRGVNLHKDDAKKALEFMREAGAQIVNSKDLFVHSTK